MNYIVISGVFLSLFLGAVWVYSPNNQIPEDVGVVDNHLKPLRDTPNGIASVTDQASKQVEPLPIIGSVDHSFDLIVQAANGYGKVSIQRRTANYMHLVFTTKLMRYQDDVEWVVNEQGTIDVRSQSRIGKGDMGENRKRYQHIRDYYLSQKDPA